MGAGLDSLAAVELRNSLQTAFSTDLPITMTFDYPTVQALSGLLAARLAETQVAAAPPLETTAAGPTVSDLQHHILLITRGLLGRDVEPSEPLMEAGLDSLGRL